MISVAFVVALQLALSGGPQDDAEGCIDKFGTTTLSACYSERADVWDKRLQAAYPAALAFVSEPQRHALERAEAAWLRYRAATCEFYTLLPGSLHYIQGAYCMLDLTRRRALELEEYILP